MCFKIEGRIKRAKEDITCYKYVSKSCPGYFVREYRSSTDIREYKNL